MKPEEIRQYIDETLEEVLIMDGYDDCILGICERFAQAPIVAYDRAAVIARHMADGMTEDEAEEFLEFNQLGAGMGDGTPCFVTVLNDSGGCRHADGCKCG
jgi:hypothetical protein